MGGKGIGAFESMGIKDEGKAKTLKRV